MFLNIFSKKKKRILRSKLAGFAWREFKLIKTPKWACSLIIQDSNGGQATNALSSQYASKF